MKTSEMNNSRMYAPPSSPSRTKALLVATMAAVACAMPSRLLAAAHEARLTFSGYEGTTTLTNFQALVKLNNGIYGFHYADYGARDGSDLWFTDSDGNVIPHEIDTWNGNGGASYVWVRVPELKDSSTYIVMHWGAARTYAQISKLNVWKNYNDGKGGFAGVWHMNANLADEPDAAGNGLVAMRVGADTNTMKTAGGVIGNGRINQTVGYNSTAGNGLKVSGYGSYITDVARFTLSGWFRGTAGRGADNWTQMFSSDKWNARGGERGQYKIIADISVGGSSISSPAPDSLPEDEGFVDTWCYLAVVFDGTSCRLYANGKSLGSWPDTTAVSGFADFFKIGNVYSNNARGWYGKYDEVRMYDGAQSEDRVKADYATMNAPLSFLTSDATEVMPAYATWTGEANDGNVMNAVNWDCRDEADVRMSGVLPSGATAVTIVGENLYINASANQILSCDRVTVENCTLGSDCDLRGIVPVTFKSGSLVDMKGYSLKVASLDGTGTITNSVAGNAADLFVYVASGETMQDFAATIGGNIRLVKEGKGTYVATKTKQTYSGGTLVEDGTMCCSGRGSGGQFGTNYVITVNANGAFDMCGNVEYHQYQFVLNGGTLMNSVAVPSDYAGWTKWADVRLTANSTIRLRSTYGFLNRSSTASTLDLGGNTLMVRLTDGASTELTFRSTAILNGTIETAVGGWLHTTTTSGSGVTDIGSPTFDLKMSTALNIERTLNVRDYMSLEAYNSNRGTAALNVYGTFTPTTQYFYGCTMQDGSTMDLTRWPESAGWPMYSRFTKGTTNLTFTAGTVNVKLAGRSDLKTLANAERPYVITWDSMPETDFELDADTAAHGFRLSKDATGLRFGMRRGLEIIVR